jgi:hypothetical protein
MQKDTRYFDLLEALRAVLSNISLAQAALDLAAQTAFAIALFALAMRTLARRLD